MTEESTRKDKIKERIDNVRQNGWRTHGDTLEGTPIQATTTLRMWLQNPGGLPLELEREKWEGYNDLKEKHNISLWI